MNNTTQMITQKEAKTLAGLFRERVKRTPEGRAYLYFDRQTQQWRDISWAEAGQTVARWQAALEGEDLNPGDRVAVKLRNCHHWVMLDQSALGMGLVTVPLYADDHSDNIQYIINDAQIRLLVMEKAEDFLPLAAEVPTVQRVITLQDFDRGTFTDERLIWLHDWLPSHGGALRENDSAPDELATIVYTSGTTGRPKGVMLSHSNILFDACAGLQQVSVYEDDLFLSFLPLSHTLERTAGYYIPMMTGACVAYARSIPELAEDLQTLQPTIMVTVPRIFERVYNKIKAQLEKKPAFARKLFELAVDVGWSRFQHSQGRAPWHLRLLLWPLLKALVAGKILAKLGGRLRLAVSGGAPLSGPIAHVFIGLGLPLVQGYGLTETSPVISVNQLEDNDPDSVGTLLPGLEARTDENGELLVRGPIVMMGYWNRPEDTQQTIDKDGWLHTGDKARLDDHGHIQITGRIKDIIVLATGEKLPPADMEMAIAMDPLFDQVMVIGEGRPYLSALLVINPDEWGALKTKFELNHIEGELLQHPVVLEEMLLRIERYLRPFPGYAQIHRIHATLEPWTIDEGLITPTLKVRRNRILEHYADEIEAMYAGH